MNIGTRDIRLVADGNLYAVYTGHGKWEECIGEIEKRGSWRIFTAHGRRINAYPYPRRSDALAALLARYNDLKSRGLA